MYKCWMNLWDVIFPPQLELCFILPCTKTSNWFWILHTHSGHQWPHFTGNLQSYSTGRAMRRITWFLCDCSSVCLPVLSFSRCILSCSRMAHCWALKLFSTCLDTSSTSSTDTKASCQSSNRSLPTISYIPSTQAFSSETFHLIWRGHLLVC